MKKKINELGHALSFEDVTKGVASLAFPVKNQKGVVIASISITGSPRDFGDKYLSNFMKLVGEAADDLSVQITV